MRLRREFAAGFAVLLWAAPLGCGPGARRDANILLFTGRGTSPGDVEAIEAILEQSQLAYSTAGAWRLNAMTESEMAAFRLLIVPGGNFVEMGNGLTAGAAANVRNAVKGGVHYLGLCAGGFLAGHFPAPYRSFDLSGGVQFGFYAPVKNGIHKAAVRITTADGRARDHYWEDGPQFDGWGEVVGTYPDGAPAIVEGPVGRGWAVLSGVHPEAPEHWRRGMIFRTPASEDAGYARTLIAAALNRTQLAHF